MGRSGRAVDDEHTRKLDLVLAASWLVPGAGHLLLGLRIGWPLLTIWLVCIVPTWAQVLPLAVGMALTAVPWLAAQIHLWRHVARVSANGSKS